MSWGAKDQDEERRARLRGHAFEGTPRQIVEAMHYIAFWQENRTLGEYIDWLGDQVERLEETPLKVEGATDEEKAASFIDEMLRTGLAGKMLRYRSQPTSPVEELRVGVHRLAEVQLSKVGEDFGKLP